MTRPAPVIWGSGRAHEILGTAEALIEERLKKIVGMSHARGHLMIIIAQPASFTKKASSTPPPLCRSYCAN